VLDLGCGTGPFLAVARARGFTDLTGVEPAPAAAAAARQRSGAVVHQAALEEAPLPEGRHALVTLWDVVEHLAAPGDALARAAALLRPGGLLAVATPNRRGLSARAFGARAQVVSPPEHLLVATRAGLEAALRRAGLVVRRAEALELRLREWTGRGGAAAPPEAGRDRYRRAYAGLTGARLFPLLHAAANAVLSVTGLGDQLLLLAERPAPGEARR
jgi:SAM-dependent methyltransferase